jgi:hypothetical protein
VTDLLIVLGVSAVALAFVVALLVLRGHRWK